MIDRIRSSEFVNDLFDCMPMAFLLVTMLGAFPAVAFGIILDVLMPEALEALVTTLFLTSWVALAVSPVFLRRTVIDLRPSATRVRNLYYGLPRDERKMFPKHFVRELPGASKAQAWRLGEEMEQINDYCKEAESLKSRTVDFDPVLEALNSRKRDLKVEVETYREYM